MGVVVVLKAVMDVEQPLLPFPVKKTRFYVWSTHFENFGYYFELDDDHPLIRDDIFAVLVNVVPVVDDDVDSFQLLTRCLTHLDVLLDLWCNQYFQVA